jgi:hypothetical protein
MKKILFLVTLILAIALITGSKKPPENYLAEKNAKTDSESIKLNKTPASTARIRFLLSRDKNIDATLWWKYDPAKSGETGC